MKKPAIQNIPIRTDIGRKLAKELAERHTFPPVDYAYIELRLLAELKVCHYNKAWCSGGDMLGVTVCSGCFWRRKEGK